MKRFIAALFFLAACAAEQPVTTTATESAPTAPSPPTAEEALHLIANAPEFGEFEFTDAGLSIPVAGSSMSPTTRAAAQDLASAGWIAFDGAGDIMLTPKARNDKRFILRPNGILDIVPLAKKEMVGVTGVRTTPDGRPAVDFTWRWIPNEIGATLQSGLVGDRFAGTQQATARLIWDGTSWMVLGIDRR